MTEKYRELKGDKNQCAGCGELFKSTAAFDKHRTGDFGIDRRCMNTEQMLAKKMAKNAHGFWVTALNPMFNKEEECEPTT